MGAGIAGNSRFAKGLWAASCRTVGCFESDEEANARVPLVGLRIRKGARSLSKLVAPLTRDRFLDEPVLDDLECARL